MKIRINGHLRKQDGFYHAVVNIPTGNGIIKQRSKSTKLPVAGNNKRKAEAFLKAFIAQTEQELQENSKAFEEFLPLYLDWLNTIMPGQVRSTTLYQYRKSYEEHIAQYPPFQSLKLRDVSPKLIQDFYIHLLNRLSPNTIKKIHCNLNSFFKYAWNMEMIDRNPAARVTLPKQQKTTVGGAYTEEEIARLLKVFENDILYPAVFLGVTYGLRRSEVCGLKWENIDFEKGFIHICHTAVHEGGKVKYVDDTKSKTSNRILPLIKPAEEVFHKVQKKQQYYKSLLKDEYFESDYVCTWENGKPILPNYLTLRFRRVLTKANQKDKSLKLPVLRYHDLRHSAASLLHAKGVPLNNIRAWLGHSDISTTANIYTHFSAEENQKMADVMTDFLSVLGK